MATGPWHYEQAEWLLKQNSTPSATPGRMALIADADPVVLTAALVHALLGLTAATAASRFTDMPVSAAEAWLEAIGETAAGFVSDGP